jgi:two-component system cell cycle sensor histidine kinase/response regulator CckA
VFSVITLDRHGVIDSCDEAVETLFGYPANALIGRHLSLLIADMPDVLGPGHYGLDCEVSGRHQDGSTLPMHVTMTELRSGNRPGYIAIVRDVADFTRRQEELLRAKKLEAIGVLAGGIAHGFNNILTAVMGNISLAKAYGIPHDEMLTRLTAAEDACQRAADMVQQLLTFSEGGAPICKTTSIVELVSAAASFALDGTNVSYEMILPEELWPVEVDARQIRHVLYNILVNAVQAMSRDGTVYIRAENLTLRPEPALPSWAERYVKITIQDQGDGIAPEQLDKIFDPFFTTKPPGYGLGLAIAHAIVSKHHGTITVESAVGAGTTFSISLPASHQALPPSRTEDTGPDIGQHKILVMDDEAMIREVLSLALTHMGYEVACAEDGVEAITLYQSARGAGQPFAAVILDVLIPTGMGGVETMLQLQQLDPQVKAIVCSGYANDPVMAAYAQYGFSGVLTKPFTVQELHDVIQRVVHGVPEMTKTSQGVLFS